MKKKTNAKLTTTKVILMSCVDLIILGISWTAYEIIVKAFDLKKAAFHEDLLIIGSLIAGLSLVYWFCKAGLIDNETYTLTDVKEGLIRWKGDKK